MFRWQAGVLLGSILFLSLAGILHWLRAKGKAWACPGWRVAKTLLFSLGLLGLFMYAWYRRDLLLGLGLVFFTVLLLGNKD